jgi:hypothetical protein
MNTLQFAGGLWMMWNTAQVADRRNKARAVFDEWRLLRKRPSLVVPIVYDSSGLPWNFQPSY